MTKKQKSRLIEAIIHELISHGFIEDAYGNFVNSDKSIRYKFGKRCLRKEQACRNYEGKIIWKRTSSGYYSALFFDESGKLRGLTR